MQKHTLWLVFALVCIYLTLVYCEEEKQQPQEQSGTELEEVLRDFLGSDSTDLQEEGRTRRRHRHHLWHRWGFTALAIAYLVKIKMVIVAFFVGSAVYLGLRYVWPSKCNQEIILDHPPPSFSHHDHIPYSLDHSDHHEHYAEHPHFDTSSWDSSSSGISSFDPYSAYSSSFTSSDAPPPEAMSSEKPTFRFRREVNSQEEKEVKEEARQKVPMATEEQIGNFMFMFLGLDSQACRRRFICEMEFRSKANPLTAMAFRIVGRSFFEKYTNARNPLGKAHSYGECATVNVECIFIENENAEEEETTNTNEATPESSVDDSIEAEEHTTEDLKVDLPTEKDQSLESNNIEERANYQNLLAERRNAYRRRLRGDRHLKQQ